MTILVVEDNDFVRTQIVRYLNDAGYETNEAIDGDSAFNHLDNGIKLALVDVRMEPVGGFEFIDIMRNHGYELPVILITGDQDPDILDRATRSGVNTILLKPIKKDRLISMVGRILEKG